MVEPKGSPSLPTPNFWEKKRLDQMTTWEWESLCDGCGRCCLYVLQDTNTDRIFHTRVACQFMDMATCRCLVYARRHELQPHCTILTPGNLEELACLPSTCAYKRVAQGQNLEWWHPLISGIPATVHLAGASIWNKAIFGQSIATDQLANYIIRDDEWNR